MKQDKMSDAYSREVERIKKADKEAQEKVREVSQRMQGLYDEIAAIAEEYAVPVDLGYDRQYVPKSFAKRCAEIDEDDPDRAASELAEEIGTWIRGMEYDGLEYAIGWWETSNC